MSIKTAGNCNILWDETYQEMDGFGICGAFRQANNLLKYPKTERDQLLDMLFSQTQGAGFSIIRNIIGDGGTWGDQFDGPTPTIEPTEGVWNWSGDEDQILFMQEAKKRGCNKFISTAWSPPAWMKTTNDVANGGYLREDKYQAYADYLSNYVREYKSRFGIEIYGISPQNEPDLSIYYSSCIWIPDQYRDFIKGYLKPTFDRDQVTAKVIMPETTCFGAMMSKFAGPALNDTEACSRIDIVAGHGYGGVIEPIKIATSRGKKVWMTEISKTDIGGNDPSIDNGIEWAKTVYEYLVRAQVNAFIYFWGAAKYYDMQTTLLGLKLEDHTVVINKRLFTIGNFSRFIRPGYIRIRATEIPCHDVYISAFKEETTGKFVVVAINDNLVEKNVTFTLHGFITSFVTPWRTSKIENLSKLENIPVMKRAILVKLRAKSVTTFEGKSEDSTLRSRKNMY